MPKKCPFCLLIEGQKPHEVVIQENSKFLVIPDQMPSSKGHSLLISREHLPHLTDMNPADWVELLPLFKDILQRFNNHLSPQGFNCYFWAGREEGATGALQSVPHFHINIVPVYQQEYGLNWYVTRIKKEDNTNLKPTLAEYQAIVEKLQPNSEGIIQATEHLTLKLVPAEVALIPGHLIIKSKNSLSNNLFLITPEIWSQIGELIQTSLSELRHKLPVKNIQVEFPLGKLSGSEQQNITEFQLHILPFQAENYAYQKPEQKSREYLRIAHRLEKNDPEELAYKQELRQAKLAKAKNYWIERIKSLKQAEMTAELSTEWESKIQALESLKEVEEFARRVLQEEQTQSVQVTTPFNPNK